MTDKTEDQIAKEKSAVDSMKNAKANMATAIDRIETLETMLRAAKSELRSMKNYVGQSAVSSSAGDRMTVHQVIDHTIARIDKVL